MACFDKKMDVMTMAGQEYEHEYESFPIPFTTSSTPFLIWLQFYFHSVDGERG